MEKVVSIFEGTKTINVVLTDEYLDFLAEKFIKQEENQYITFEQFVERDLWKNSSRKPIRKAR